MAIYLDTKHNRFVEVTDGCIKDSFPTTVNKNNTKIDKPYCELANAIVIETLKDYQNELKILHHFIIRYNDGYKLDRMRLSIIKHNLLNLRELLFSEYFYFLCSVDYKGIVDKLDNKLLNELGV